MCKRPKRRKHKDNSYVLNYNKELNKYTIKFKNQNKGIETVEIDELLYTVFEKFELDDISWMNKYDRHIEHLEQTDELIYKKSIFKCSDIEDIVYKKILYEELYNAINMLPDIQKRRIKMYYFDDMTLQEIASKEKTTFQAVSKSIKNGIKKLKCYLKKLKFEN